ncbi:MAG TPA: hypothetical protein VIH99_05390 [Bdellovibrionota bacterium]|jgi:hypothetical protein
MHIIFLLLLVASPAFATTKIAERGQPQRELCRVRAKFVGRELSRATVKKRGRVLTADSVFWKMEIQDVSNKNICPEGKDLKLRVRGASFHGSAPNVEVTYAVDVSEPAAGSLVDLKVEFSQGRDTFTKIDFAEWILKEVVSE